MWSEVMIWCEAVTLELRKLEAGAREERHRMQDDSNSRWFYRRHLEQGRRSHMPVWREGGDGMWGYSFFETFVPNIWSTRVADSAETICSAETMVSLLNYTSVAGQPNSRPQNVSSNRSQALRSCCSAYICT